MMVMVVVWHRMQMMVVRRNRCCTGINLRRSVFVASSMPTTRTAIHQLCHEGDVGDGQTQGLYPRQTLLVSKRWHFASQLVKSFVQVEHPAAFANICSSSLGYRSDPSPGLLGRGRHAAAGSRTPVRSRRGTSLANQGYLTARPEG